MRRSAGLLAAAVLVGTAGTVGTAAPATAAAPTHVAIVIAGHGVACVPWHSGITGDEVLNDVATVTYRPTDGIITQIDGTPKNNRADDTHYWSYWHDTGSGWTYSTAGAGAYHPRAGTVEGWHFINGSSTATPPPTRTYASICHHTVVVAPVAPSTKRAPATVTSHAAPRTSTRPGTSAAPVSSATAPASRAVPTSASRSSIVAPPSTAPSSSALPTLHVHNTADTHRPDSGSALPTVLVVAIVLALGGAVTVVAQRRRRHT